MLQKGYEQLLNEVSYYKSGYRFMNDKVGISFWIRNYAYDEIVINYIMSNINQYKTKDGSIDLLKLYDDIITHNIINVKMVIVEPYNIFRIVWKHFTKYIPNKDDYNRMMNNATLAYRFHRWSDKKDKRRRSYVRVKKVLFDVLSEDYKAPAGILAERVDMPVALVKRILLDDLREII